jgi:hypothetical protein
MCGFLSVIGVHYLSHVRKRFKLYFGHTDRWCPQPIVFGQAEWTLPKRIADIFGGISDAITHYYTTEFMTNDELPTREPTQWARVPYTTSPNEPFASVRIAVDAYRQWLHERHVKPEASLVDALVAACTAAVEAGTPYTAHGPRGVFERRASLPEPLAGLSSRRLRSLTARAVADGLLMRGSAGCGRYGALTAP